MAVALWLAAAYRQGRQDHDEFDCHCTQKTVAQDLSTGDQCAEM